MFGRYVWFSKCLPKYVYEWKLNHAKTLLEIDKLFGVEPVWGLTQKVISNYPQFLDELTCNDQTIFFHYHDKNSKSGKGRWMPTLCVTRDNMVYDRQYSLQNKKVLPKNGEAVVWHIDHPNNLYCYLRFLQDAKKAGLI